MALLAGHSCLKSANKNLGFEGTPCDNTSQLGRSPAEAQVTPPASSLCLKEAADGYKHPAWFASSFTELLFYCSSAAKAASDFFM